MKANNSWEERLHHFSHPFYAFIRSGRYDYATSDPYLMNAHGQFWSNRSSSSLLSVFGKLVSSSYNTDTNYSKNTGNSVHCEQLDPLQIHSKHWKVQNYYF